jgi:signal transduction histidine kinase/CheY-like chemotaxis protein
MMARDAAGLDDRVLLLAPTGKDAATTAALLREAGIAVAPCASLDEVLREIGRGAAAVILPEEVITPVHNAHLVRVLHGQPAWSDLPMLVLTHAGADSVTSSEAMRTLGNVTLLERPLRVSTLVSAVRSAVRARQRQYQIRGHLAERARTEEALRIADRRKDEFLATLGHELRNPLAPLLSGVHLLRVAGTQDARITRILSVMDRQVRHLVRLVDDLLEVSRITRGLIDVRHDPIDLVVVIRSALENSRSALEAGRHQLQVDLPAEPIPVVGDAVRLTQVFANLLTNAAKYTNTGGEIRLTAKHEAGHARVSIRDNGIGIPASHLAAVFDMFMQVDRSDRRAQGGLGIGLTLVRTLVEMHGGRVEAHSDGPGTGTEFVVSLPALEDSLAEPQPAGALREMPARRVMIVDDNRDAAEMLGALLEALGAIVQVVDSGRAALDMLDGFDPDAVLLDIGMPEMDGYEVARRLRAQPDRAGTLLIALTGWGQDQDQENAKAAGFNHHLVKPPDIDRLRELLIESL